MKLSMNIKSRDSSVDIETRLDDRGLDSRQRLEFFSPPQPERLGVSPRLLFNGYWMFFPRG